MFSIEVNLFFLIVCNILLKCHGLEKISSAEDNTILITESIIRNTTNKIFTTIKIKNVKSNQKIRQFALTHNFMISVTFRDHKALNTIVKLSRVDNNVSNETQNLVNLINEVLNEDWKEEEIESISSNENVVQYVDEFLTKLEGFKENCGYYEYKTLDIKEDVLGMLNDINTKPNGTRSGPVEEEDDILVDNDFWIPENQTRRIFQGEKTKIKHFPFMASIQMFNSFQCGGSIINADLILTAASCLQLAWNNRFYRENPAFLSVRVGSNFFNAGGENIPVLEVYFHPDYNPKNLRHNICILRLLRRLKFRKKKKRKVMTIEIDRNASPLPSTTDGVTIIGWGATGASNIVKNPWSNRLAFAVLDVYHLQECQEIYSREYVTRNNFCAGFISKGGGACNRDVGGPGVASGKLVGVVSFGSPVCGTPDAPTVFTKVGYYADWIEEIRDMPVPYIAKRTTTPLPPVPIFNTTPLPHRITTVKMAPLIQNYKPKHIAYQDNLRILEDEDLFKEFLNTMFASKEAQDYTDLLNDVAVGKARQDGEEKLYDVVDEESVKNFRQGKNLVTKLDSFVEVVEEATPKLPDTNVIKKKKVDFINPSKKDYIEKILDIENFNKHEAEVVDKVPDLKNVNNDSESNQSSKDISVELVMSKKQKKKVKDEFAYETSIVKKNKHRNEIDYEFEVERLTTKMKNHKQKNKEIQIETATVKINKLNKKKKNFKKGVEKFTAETLGKKTDDVVTLLYLSDEENPKLDNIGNLVKDFDDNINSDDGMAISLDGFSDLTFRNNKTDSLLNNIMSRAELYDILDDAVNFDGI